LNESSALKPAKDPLASRLPVPSAVGSWLAGIALFALTLGLFRRETAWTLLSAVFLTVLAYSFVAVYLVSLARRRVLRTISCGVFPLEPGTDDQVRIFLPDIPAGEIRWRLPGILARCEIALHTRDGRSWQQCIDPDRRPLAGYGPFPAGDRGAYYSSFDHLVFYDAFGLFSRRYRLPQVQEPRLLVRPRPSEELLTASVATGGREVREEPRYRRTEDLTDHRPYHPGDDPRRINWKLYGHAGDLFVREGEGEPPPRSRYVIILDCSVDRSLYNEETGRRGIDLLAEQTLGLAVELYNRGMHVLAGYSGSTISALDPGTGSRFLAFPAALPLDTPADLPVPTETYSVLVLALPRTRSESSPPSALDRFLIRCHQKTLDLVFIQTNKIPADAVSACIASYAHKGGLRVHGFPV